MAVVWENRLHYIPSHPRIGVRSGELAPVHAHSPNSDQVTVSDRSGHGGHRAITNVCREAKAKGLSVRVHSHLMRTSL
jgi:hypothetical protein